MASASASIMVVYVSGRGLAEGLRIIIRFSVGFRFGTEDYLDFFPGI